MVGDSLVLRRVIHFPILCCFSDPLREWIYSKMLHVNDQLELSHFYSINQVRFDNAPVSVMTIPNAKHSVPFGDLELTNSHIPSISTTEHQPLPAHGDSLRESPSSDAIYGVLNRSANIDPGKNQISGHLHPVLKAKPRKRRRDSTLPGPNRYGRTGTLRCYECRHSRLKVCPLHGV